jgi:hypothetical protein
MQDHGANHTREMRSSLVDLALQVLLFLVYDLENLVVLSHNG